MVRNVFILKMMRIKYAMSIVLLCLPFLTFAQKEDDQIREGNKAFDKGDYASAANKYMEAQKLNDKSFGANYNLGNALYKEGKYKEALDQYKIADTKTQDKSQKAQVYHNIGNSYLQQKDYANSVKSYKESLRYNPKDEDTRYNLAYAQKMLVNQQQQQQQQQQQKNDDQKKDEQKEDQQQPQPQMQNDNTEQILDALDEEERKMQEKEGKKQKAPYKYKVEKDW